MRLDPMLLEVLACPIDKGPLLYFEDEDRLYNPRLRRSYAVREGIPVMLIDESTEVDDREHERLVAKAHEEGIPKGAAAGEGAAEAGAAENTAAENTAAGERAADEGDPE
jgi:uncharacterized protein YbaR (Trm112 family)